MGRSNVMDIYCSPEDMSMNDLMRFFRVIATLAEGGTKRDRKL